MLNIRLMSSQHYRGTVIIQLNYKILSYFAKGQYDLLKSNKFCHHQWTNNIRKDPFCININKCSIIIHVYCMQFHLIRFTK